LKLITLSHYCVENEAHDLKRVLDRKVWTLSISMEF